MSIIGEGLEILGLIDKAKNAAVYRQLGDYIGQDKSASTRGRTPNR